MNVVGDDGSSRPAYNHNFSATIPMHTLVGYIPCRLDADERRLLNILENALDVSEYTDTVDVTFSHLRTSKKSRIFTSLMDILSIASGLIISNDLSAGENLFSEKSIDDNVPLFAKMFEIGRRYKMMNPGKMRDTYGKLIYILMDIQQTPDLSELAFAIPILTVERLLKDTGMEDMVTDHLMEAATDVMEDDADAAVGEGAASLSEKSARKYEATKALIDKYGGTDEELRGIAERVIWSIGDYRTFLTFSVGPVQDVRQLLQKFFQANDPHAQFTLSLKGHKPFKSDSTKEKYSSYNGFYYRGNSLSYSGQGACLSHDHATQWTFVLQSLTLWHEIMSNLPVLWFFADRDMLMQTYRLVDTGQGYQRLQSCPQIGGFMREILHRVQRKFNGWVGLSVIHLGDRDVPNALMFIDKYTQVPRILDALRSCIRQLPGLVSVPSLHTYIENEWGSIDALRLQILSDYFKHGFDGSGDDGGSCIDGRLTSTWNWCSKLEKKPYHAIFMFTGFQGFDGNDGFREP